MNGETNLGELLKGMTPVLNNGEYIFSTVKDLDGIDSGYRIETGQITPKPCLAVFFLN